MNVISIDTTENSPFIQSLSQSQRTLCGEKCIGYINPFNINVVTGGTHIENVVVTIPKFAPSTHIEYIKQNTICHVNGTINKQPVTGISSYRLLAESGVLDQCQKDYQTNTWVCKMAKLFVKPEDIIIATDANGKMC